VTIPRVPDAETLAAYSRGSLSAEEMSAARKHLLGARVARKFWAACGHPKRQRITKSGDQLVAVGAVARAKMLKFLEKLSTPAVATRSPKETESKGHAFPEQEKWLQRWAAPAGAIAAGCCFISASAIFVRQRDALNHTSQIAENREDNAPRS